MSWWKPDNFVSENNEDKTPIPNEDTTGQTHVQIQASIIQQQNGSVKVQDLKDELKEKLEEKDEQGIWSAALIEYWFETIWKVFKLKSEKDLKRIL